MEFWLLFLFIPLCGCVWLAVCDNSVWFWGCVLGLVGVSLSVRLWRALVVFTTMLTPCLCGLVGVVSVC